MTSEYNCEDMASYEGLTFVTENGSRYSIREGRLHGRSSLEGTCVKLVSGVTEREGWHFRSSILPDEGYHPQAAREMRETFIYRLSILPDEGYHPHAAEEVQNYVRSIAKPVKEGLQLMIALDDEAARKYQRHGFVTSAIKSIKTEV